MMLTQSEATLHKISEWLTLLCNKMTLRALTMRMEVHKHRVLKTNLNLTPTRKRGTAVALAIYKTKVVSLMEAEE
jgi:hypothetical protein